MFRSDIIANTGLTIFQTNGISVKAWSAKITRSAECVVQTMNAVTGDTVT